MQLAHPFIRLPLQFDASRLREEVLAIPEDAWNPHPQGFPGNSALLLISREGNPRDDALSGPMLPTPNLDALPYLRQVLASFSTVWGRSRLMRIDGNAEANWHMDANYYWHQRVRMHVPIQTNNAVTFHCGDDTVNMKAGESWIFNTWKMHNVVNPHPDRRIHLVADTTGSALFWDLVARGQPHPGDGDHWHPDPVLPWQPDVEATLDTEHWNTPGIMSPWEMLDLVRHVFTDIPPGARAEAAAHVRTFEAFQQDWRTLWSRFRDQRDGLPAYKTLRDAFLEKLNSLPDIMLGNRMSLPGMLRTLSTVFINEAMLERINRSSPVTVTSVATNQATATAAVAPAEKTVAAPQGSDPFNTPVFIVAAPRSGSSWLFETLSESSELLTLGGEGHPHIESIEALDPRRNGRWHNRLDADDATPDTARQLRANYLAGLKDHNGQAVQPTKPFRFLEKTPKNALRIAFLKKVFPQARFIYLHRDPRENIASIIEAWKSGRFVTYKNLPGWQGQPWSLLLPPEWQTQQGKPPEAVASWQWQATNAAIVDELSRLPRNDWTSISYQELCQDTDAALAKLCAFIGITPLAQDSSKKLSQHTLTPPDPNKWRKHEAAIMAEESAWSAISNRIDTLEHRPPETPAEDASRMTAPATPTSPQGDTNATPPAMDFSSVFTTGMPAILKDLGTTLLVTTYQAGKLIVVREQEGRVNTHFRLLKKPMGLVGDINRFAVGTLNQIIEYRNMPSVARNLESPLAHDGVYVPRQLHFTGDVDIHEMVFANDGRLWFANTRFSCLCVRDFDHSFVPVWRPPFVTGYAPEDRCHLNGLGLRDGVPRYVTMLGQTNTRGGWRENKRDGGLLMDISDNRIIAERLSMPHSPRWYRDQLWVLESGEGSLAKVNVDTGELTHVCKLPGFTRGLDFYGDFAFIGLSQVRESATFSGLPLTERDEPRSCGVWVVNINTGQTLGFLRFEGSVQEIFSVQAIPGCRHPEVLELDHPLISSSYALPDDALKEVDFDAIAAAEAERAKQAAANAAKDASTTATDQTQ